MKDLIQILKKVKPDIDFVKDKNLSISDIFDSFDMIFLVSLIEEKFKIKTKPKDIVPENFNAIETIYEMINKIKKERK